MEEEIAPTPENLGAGQVDDDGLSASTARPRLNWASSDLCAVRIKSPTRSPVHWPAGVLHYVCKFAIPFKFSFAPTAISLSTDIACLTMPLQLAYFMVIFIPIPI